ncbi:hypothetical protein [Roseateles sp.]|uniref:hypothetical protein n=1 Tax=Roseateles sp. TaxID=1971397 RepID=UPI003BABF150
MKRTIHSPCLLPHPPHSVAKAIVRFGFGDAIDPSGEFQIRRWVGLAGMRFNPLLQRTATPPAERERESGASDNVED